MQRQAEEDARNKQFRARQFNPSHYKDVVVRRTARGSEPGGRKVTQPKGPSFMTDDRLGYRRDVLEGRFADTHEAHRARHAESMARREVCFKIEGRNRLEKLEHAWYVFFFSGRRCASLPCSLYPPRLECHCLAGTCGRVLPTGVSVHFILVSAVRFGSWLVFVAVRCAGERGGGMQEKARLEAERLAKEREFKARPAPKPSTRFKLDASKVKPSTIPKPFALSGPRGVPPETPGSEAASRGRDSMDVHTPIRVVTPQGVMSEFMRSLRV